MKKILLVLLTVSSVGYAASAACPTATVATQDPNHADNDGTNVQTPGSGPGNDLATVNTLSGGTFNSGGCLATDLSFNNFRIVASGNGGITVGGTVTADGNAGAALLSTGADTYANFASSTNLETVEFATVRGTGGGAEGTDTDGLNNFYDNGGSPSTFNILFTVDAPTGGMLYGSHLSIRFYNFTNPDDVGAGLADNFITVTMCGDYTKGASAQTTGFASCGGGGPGGTLITPYTVSLDDLQGDGLLALATNTFTFSRVYVNLAITLDGSNSTTPTRSESTFYGVQMGFADAPEPGTFGLMGAALLGLGWIARRRKA